LLKLDHQHLYADSNLHKFEPPKPAELKTFRLDKSVKEAALAERFRRAILKSSLCRGFLFKKCQRSGVGGALPASNFEKFSINQPFIVLTETKLATAIYLFGLGTLLISLFFLFDIYFA